MPVLSIFLMYQQWKLCLTTNFLSYLCRFIHQRRFPTLICGILYNGEQCLVRNRIISYPSNLYVGKIILPNKIDVCTGLSTFSKSRAISSFAFFFVTETLHFRHGHHFESIFLPGASCFASSPSTHARSLFFVTHLYI